MMPLPPPRATLLECVWLPRIIAKARLLRNDALPADYEARFCHPGGVDAQFLSFFGISKDDILMVCRSNDAEVAAWFNQLTSSRPTRISEWNHLAENLGRPGFPMAERLPIALATIYQHLDPSKIRSVFEAIEADEA
jgi:Domain of unknown function (DUF5069)